MKKSTIVVVLLALVKTSYILAIPLDFNELYQYNPKDVSLKSLDGQQKTPIHFMVNYDTVKLPDDTTQTLLELQNYFKLNNITPSLQKKIISALKTGVKTDDRCEGRYSTCIITPAEFSFVYDFEDNELRLFINPRYLKKQSAKKDYANSFNDNPALINHFNLYINSFSGRDDNYTISDQTIIGLPYGYLHSDINYNIQDENNDFELYELAYDLNLGNKQLQIGHFRYGVNINATDFLSANSQFSENSITFGSSPNLLLNQSNNYERLYFFSPAKGELRIYRGERLIVQKNISEGQGFITYSDLPSGRYNIRVEIVVAGDIISSEQRQIFNSSNDSLVINGIDYTFSIGMFDKSKVYYNQFNGDDLLPMDDPSTSLDNEPFYKGLLAYRPYNSLILGLGSMYSQNNYYGQIGVEAYLPYNSKLNIVGSLFESGATHYEIFLSSDYISIQYESYTNPNLSDDLAAYIYGDADFTQLTFSSNYQFKTGQSSYFIYTLNNNDSNKSFDGYNFWSSTIGIYSPFIASSNIDISVTYQSDIDELSTSLTWSIPLSDNVSGQTLISTDGNKLSQFRNSLSKNNLLPFDDTSSQIEAGNTYYNSIENKNISDVSLSANTHRKTWDGNFYSYADSEGLLGISGGISSSQIITKDANVHFTSINANSYFALNIEGTDSENNNGFLTLRRNGTVQNKTFIYDKHPIYALSDYDNYTANLNTNSVSLLNSGDYMFSGFSYPGSVVTLNAKLSKIISFVSAFSDILGNSIDTIECVGEGCLKINKIMDGVFKVSLSEGSPFKLITKNQTCIIPKTYANVDSLNFGENYCLPNIGPTSTIVLQENQHPVTLYYIGIFNNTIKINEKLKEIETNNAKILKVNLGTDIAVYLKSDGKNIKFPKHAQKLIQNIRLLSKDNVNIASLKMMTGKIKENKT